MQLTDAEFVRLYREFSEDCYAAGWMSWTTGTLDYFARWLKDHRQLDLESYEREALNAWRDRQGESGA